MCVQTRFPIEAMEPSPGAADGVDEGVVGIEDAVGEPSELEVLLHGAHEALTLVTIRGPARMKSRFGVDVEGREIMLDLRRALEG